MENNVLVSIIIPMFNSEKFILNILNNLIEQSYSNFEVLLIDDGSTDNTKLICEKICCKDHRFKYFYKENGGASSARNIGIDKSIGEVLTFIDSDDEISDDYLDYFIDNYLDNNKPDIISCPISAQHFKKNNSQPKNALKINDKNKIINNFFLENFGIGPTSKIYKKSIVNNIIFDTSLVINEDKLFLYNYLRECNSALILPESKYFVNLRRDSISNTQSFNRKCRDMFYVYKKIDNSCKGVHYNNKKYHDIKCLLFVLKNYLRFNSFQFVNSKFEIDLMREINISKKQKGIISFKNKIELFLLRYFPAIYLLALKKYYA